MDITPPSMPLSIRPDMQSGITISNTTSNAEKKIVAHDTFLYWRMLFNKVFIIFSLPLFFLCSTFRFAAGAAVNIKVIAYPYEISTELFDFFFAE